MPAMAANWPFPICGANLTSGLRVPPRPKAKSRRALFPNSARRGRPRWRPHFAAVLVPLAGYEFSSPTFKVFNFAQTPRDHILNNTPIGSGVPYGTRSHQGQSLTDTNTQDVAASPDLQARAKTARTQAEDWHARAHSTESAESRSVYLSLSATYASLANELPKTADTIEAVRESANGYAQTPTLRPTMPRQLNGLSATAPSSSGAEE